MTREEHQRHLDTLTEGIVETCATLQRLEYERDIEAAWLNGYDACECMNAAMMAAAMSTAGLDDPELPENLAVPPGIGADGEGIGPFDPPAAEPTARDVLTVLDDTPQSLADIAKHFGSTVPVVTRLLTELGGEARYRPGSGWMRKPERTPEAKEAAE